MGVGVGVEGGCGGTLPFTKSQAAATAAHSQLCFCFACTRRAHIDPRVLPLPVEPVKYLARTAAEFCGCCHRFGCGVVCQRAPVPEQQPAWEMGVALAWHQMSRMPCLVDSELRQHSRPSLCLPLHDVIHAHLIAARSPQPVLVVPCDCHNVAHWVVAAVPFCGRQGQEGRLKQTTRSASEHVSPCCTVTVETGQGDK